MFLNCLPTTNLRYGYVQGAVFWNMTPCRSVMITDILELTASNFREVSLHTTSVHENYVTKPQSREVTLKIDAVSFFRMSITLYINLHHPYTEIFNFIALLYVLQLLQ
jgi:hypothetical protein